jgi:hypothetical protein
MTRPDQPSETFATPKQLRAMFSEINVDKAVLMPLVSPEGMHCLITNEETMAIVKANRGFFYWFVGIDPRFDKNNASTDLSHFINHYKALGAKGIGEVTARLPFSDPRMQNLFRHAEKCAMPMTIHIASKHDPYGIEDDLGLPGLENTLKNYPDLQIIGHSASFWSEISGNDTEEIRANYGRGPVTSGGRIPELMRKYPNLHADISAGSGYNAITRDEAFGYGFLEEFQDQLYYATDICAPKQYEFLKLSAYLDDAVKNGRISRTAYKKICRENALKVLEKQ